MIRRVRSTSGDRQSLRRKTQIRIYAALSRTAIGSSSAELIAIGIIMVPIALLALNIAFLAFGSFYNDAACREAARAASQQSSAEAARSAATNAIRGFGVIGIGSPTMSVFEFNFKNSNPDPTAPLSNPSTPIEIPILKADADPTLAKGSGDGSAGDAPNVVVEMTLMCIVPAPILIGPNGLTSMVDLRNRYVFPILAGVEDPNDTGEDSGPSDDPPEETDDDPPPIDSDPSP